MLSNHHIGRELCYYLRHHPEDAGLDMDEGGWVPIRQIVSAMQERNPGFTAETLQAVVADDGKGRFEFDGGKDVIRACQGHSIDVDLGLFPVVPPDILYHGTALRFVDSIERQGILPMSRNHVHLSLDEGTAREIGARHGSPAVYAVDAGRMHGDGYDFYLSDNRIWLTDFVPSEYIELVRGR